MPKPESKKDQAAIKIKIMKCLDKTHQNYQI